MTENSGLIIRDTAADSIEDIRLLEQENERAALIAAGEWYKELGPLTDFSTLDPDNEVIVRHGFCKKCDRVIEGGEPSYWGVCPVCHKNDGTLNVGKAHWYFCKEHKTRWFVGANLFSTWKDQTEEEQRKIYDGLDFGTFTDVEPHRCE